MSRTALRIGLLLLVLAAVMANRWHPATVTATAPPSPSSDLLVVRTGAGFALPSVLPAGRYQVRLENHTGYPAVADFIALPDGVAPQDVLDVVSAYGDSRVPDLFDPWSAPLWLDDLLFAGGPAAGPWGTGATTIDLTPGQWLVSAFGAGPGSPAATLTVTGQAPLPDAAPVEPAATAKVVLAGGPLAPPASLAPGRQTWQIANESREPRGLVLVELGAAGEAPTLAEPLPGLASLPLGPAGGVGLLSPGASALVSLFLDPGRYALVAYTADPAGILPLDAAAPVITVGA